jgi:hypothetical protein
MAAPRPKRVLSAAAAIRGSDDFIAPPAARRRLRRLFATTAFALGALIATSSLLAAPAEAAGPASHFALDSLAGPTDFSAAHNAECLPRIFSDPPPCDAYQLTAINAGSQPTDGSPVTLADALPAALTVQRIAFFWSGTGFGTDLGSSFCDTALVRCTFPFALQPDDALEMIVYVTVDDPGASAALTNAATVSGGGAPDATTSAQNTVGEGAPGFGPDSFGNLIAGPDGLPDTQAGGHPYELTTRLGLNSVLRSSPENAGGSTPQVTSVHDVKDVVVDLPLGLLGGALAAPTCTLVQLSSQSQGGSGGCPSDTVVGHVRTDPSVATSVNGSINNLVPEHGVAAEFGYVDVLGGAHVLYARVVPTSAGYLLRVTAHDVPQVILTNIVTTFFGNPAAKDGSGNTPVAMFTNPSHCDGQPLTTTVHMDSWQSPGSFNADGTPDLSDPNWVSATSSSPPVTGCNLLHFNPTISVQPDATSADSPSGLDVELKVPQSTDPDVLATPPLRKAVVTLPQGVSVNPAAADGLGACSPAQIDLASAAEPTCPDSSKVGTVQLQSPLLPGTLTGSIFLATQNDNPFNSLLAGYIVVDDPTTGVVIKIPGKLTPDPNTGQITGVFDNNPQFPFSDLKLHFFGGNRGELATPQTCGTYTTTSELTPWSAPDSGPPATPSDSFQVTSGPNGGPCPNLTDPNQFTPGFQAGTLNPQAASYSPFLLKVTRPDGQQFLKQIHLDLPPGLVANLNGVPRCSQAQITPGVGGSTNCPSGSQIGTVTVGAGAGSSPFFLKNQPVYLTDGYNGAPYGIAIDTHAVAGPFDLGHVVIRSTLSVDKDDAQVHIDSDQIPDILQGIPLRIRSIAVNVDRPGFILNPTNCNPMALTGTVTGGGADFNAPGDDTVKPVSTPFQVAGCGSLPFNPRLSGAILNGAQGIHRSDHPNLQFNLAYTPGDANVASVAVTLPQSMQIDQANLGNICSETELAQNQCAGRNTVGTASATTPLLDSTLSGPVYAVSGSGGLPKLAVILDGPAADPVNLLVRGITDTVGARIRNTFPLVPDTPVSDFNLTLNGGHQGYLVNNTNVCAGAKGKSKKAKRKAKRLRKTNLTADAFFTAQDGDTRSQSVPISAQCPKAKKSKKSNRHARHRKHHR